MTKRLDQMREMHAAGGAPMDMRNRYKLPIDDLWNAGKMPDGAYRRALAGIETDILTVTGVDTSDGVRDNYKAPWLETTPAEIAAAVGSVSGCDTAEVQEIAEGAVVAALGPAKFPSYIRRQELFAAEVAAILLGDCANDRR